jgi:hypothetical protein
MVAERQEDARYAVVFRVGAELPLAGSLRVERQELVLDGRAHDRQEVVRIPLSELRDVRIGRERAERLNGRPTLLLTPGNGPLIQVEPLGLGLLYELADLLATLAVNDQPDVEEVAVVVPLKSGRANRARKLIARGPPFDPGIVGLSRHEVFLTANEVIFVFAGPGARATLQRASHNPSLWRVGLAWRDCMAARPHLADPDDVRRTVGLRPLYSWSATRSGL